MSMVAVVTGSNKGIGLAIVKRLCKSFNGVVYLTSRDEKRGKETISDLNKIGLYPEYHQLDVSIRSSVANFRDYIKEKHGGLDILINNAAMIDKNYYSSTYEESKQVIDITFKSILIMEEIIYPLVRENGRILNISSVCGHLSNIRNDKWIQRFTKQNFTADDVNEFVDWYLESKKTGTFNPDDIADNATVSAYRVAKVALSAITFVQQRKFESKNISINSMHPGLVRTGMTKNAGFFDIDQAAETPVHLVLEAPQKLKGAYVWYDKRVLDWYDYKADNYFKIKTIEN